MTWDLLALGMILFGGVLVVLGMIYREDADEEAYDDDHYPPIVVTERNYRKDADDPRKDTL